jgi:hypothetical protein
MYVEKSASHKEQELAITPQKRAFWEVTNLSGGIAGSAFIQGVCVLY